MSTVVEIGRLQYLVQSRSRPEIQHSVDAEPNEHGAGIACSCELNRLRLKRCHHIEQVEEHILATTK